VEGKVEVSPVASFRLYLREAHESQIYTEYCTDIMVYNNTTRVVGHWYVIGTEEQQNVTLN